MPRMVSRIVRWMSRSACVVTSPMTTHRPFVMAVSHATRACASWSSIPSRTASETWSQILSGWPSVTDSEVSRYEGEEAKEVVTTGANDTVGLVRARPLGTVVVPAVFGILAEKLRLQREDVVQHAVDAAPLHAM